MRRARELARSTSARSTSRRATEPASKRAARQLELPGGELDALVGHLEALLAGQRPVERLDHAQAAAAGGRARGRAPTRSAPARCRLRLLVSRPPVYSGCDISSDTAFWRANAASKVCSSGPKTPAGIRISGNFCHGRYWKLTVGGGQEGGLRLGDPGFADAHVLRDDLQRLVGAQGALQGVVEAERHRRGARRGGRRGLAERRRAAPEPAGQHQQHEHAGDARGLPERGPASAGATPPPAPGCRASSR